ncbi:MAG: glycosyltransferase family protein, partial [Candidatus Hydrogenedens sp.]
MGQLKILTFNFHEPYMCLMAKTGFEMDLGLYSEGLLARKWKTEFRPIPENLHEVPENEWRERVFKGYYDIVIAHNETNAWDIREANCPKILVCHNRKTYLKTTLPKNDVFVVNNFEKVINILSERFTFVFISPSKRDDYGYPGYVVLPGIDIEEYGGYAGSKEVILRVGNYMQVRNWMFDFPLQEALCKGLPNIIVGENPGVENSKPSINFEELLSAYRLNRCLLHITRQEFEDGYNLSTLEAMACGMPVVALNNRSSPITNGVDGFTSFDPAQLRKYLELLLGNPDLAREIGTRGRETVQKKFPISQFVDNWQKIILKQSGKETTSIQITKPSTAKKHYRIILDYITSPHTTARYFEFAFEKDHDVITSGFRCPEDLLYKWGFQNPPPYPPQRIPTSFGDKRIENLLAGIPSGYPSDFYIYVDSGLKTVDPMIDMLNIPRVAYLIDTHLDFQTRLEIAKHFDIVFLAQQSHVKLFKEQGVRYVFWLPLACCPELYPQKELSRDIDVSYVGSLSPDEGDKRRRLLMKVAEIFPNHYIGKKWPLEMGEVYSRSKIVVNSAINYDLNMRVFEGMAGGALLVTDPADSILELFEDGKDLVIYENEKDLIEKIRYYLEHKEEREQIARQGQQKVLESHTYYHRCQQIIKKVEEIFKIDTTKAKRLEIKPINYYSSERREVLKYIPDGTKKVLDIGCATGNFGLAMKRELGVEEVVGIEIVPDIAEIAKKVLDKVFIGNIEKDDFPFENDYFDVITCCDVLEHTEHPEKALRNLIRYLKPYGYVIISIPNVQYWGVIFGLSLGRWDYRDSGIQDITHLKFYTRDTLQEFIRKTGLLINAIGPLSIASEDIIPRDENGNLHMGKICIDKISDEEYEVFRTFQYIVIAQKLPSDINEINEQVRKLLEAGRTDLLFELAKTESDLPLWKRYSIEGKAYAHTGNLVKAQECYLKALEIEKNNELHIDYGLLLLAMNQTQTALELLGKVFQEEPENIRLHLAMGQGYLQSGNMHESYKHLNYAFSNSYDYPGILDLYIYVCEQLGYIESAEQTIKAFIDFYPGDVSLILKYSTFLS